MKNTVKAESRIAMIPVCHIFCNSSDMRGYKRKELRSLSQSIKKNGILQPITVRDITPCRFELISGERRLRAAVMAGINSVPCIILHCTERQSVVYRLVENIQREPKGIFEKAETMRRLTDEFGFSAEQISVLLGISQKQVNTSLGLLSFTADERERIIFSEIGTERLSEILSENDPEERSRLLDRAIQNEKAAQQLRRSVSVRKMIVKDMRIFVNTIERTVSVMRQSGIDARLETTESDANTEYRIIISH